MALIDKETNIGGISRNTLIGLGWKIIDLFKKS
jgi:hypothetical protein